MGKKNSKKSKGDESKDSNPKRYIEDIADDLNKQFKTAEKVAYFLNDDELSPCDITEWISTGNSILDIIISNRKDGGLPVGRIIEIMGQEASGKSLMAAHAIKSTQDKGGIGIYIDTENAFSREYALAVGVDLNNMLYIPLDTVEDIFEAVEKIIYKIRNSDSDKLVTIVIDSIMGASTKAEISSNYDKEGYATSKALILSKAMRKITNYIGRQRICLIVTNQLRHKLGASYGEQYVTSGGKAIAFHSSVRLLLKVFEKKDDKVTVIAQVVKNRLGPPFKKVNFSIFFQSGMDNYGTWLQVLKTMGRVSLAGAIYTYDVLDKDTGEVLESIKFFAKDFYTKVLSNPKLKEIIYDEISDYLILKYNAEDDIPIDIADILDDSDIEEVDDDVIEG
jgi:recombination protein RecA